MGEDLLAGLSMENYHPSTFLSMDSIAGNHEETDRDMNRQVPLSRPPDINLPLSAERSPPPPSYHDAFDMLDVGLGHQINDSDPLMCLTKNGRKCARRTDSVWGAWFFFTFYFKPVLKDKSKSIVTRDCNNGVSGFDKSDLQLEVFLVQHDMENIYMWVFKERPDNALGKMQLRSYMNGHSRQGDRPFPFSADKGFVRSHRMQRKHYRGLSNPQCLHGIELVRSPNLIGIDEEDQKKWIELTGRDLNFTVPSEANEYSSWRTLPNTDFELDRPITSVKKKPVHGSGLNLSGQPSNHTNGSLMDHHHSHLCNNNKRKKDLFPHGGNDEDCCFPLNPHSERHLDIDMNPVEPAWMNEFSGVMRNNNTYGPATAAKTLYEDEEGYLIIISLPLSDPEKVKVHWWNSLTHGIIKISSVSTAGLPFIQRNDRTFKLTDPSPEHCPPGEFKREIPLPTRIPDDAKLEAYFDKSGTVLEIMVPKHRVGPEEHEVPICLHPPNDFLLS
ncbi:uncharacterized protein LOC124916578 [Impatiens glandulifera]|uniref:uncharacterized protein LOC124916578 n=1 Tax=Impatiens glandulifera TaxID=253017 RepID=UPI001FB086E9|nr:uncharacterized protein LOC124916578 [Impatiens glandulifera]XP_047313275.1 uncharacterized protein LOC124916578 [Impatiens glandulifera]XP_047313282.1 uncharacterized protein LOC124916578 [Impatiens glandulifera]